MSSRLPRLKKRKDFLRVARNGRSAAVPGLVLQCAKQPAVPAREAAPTARVGFTASRRVGGAVARNRARRRLRVVAETVIPRHAMADRDYVLIARAATLDRRFEDLVRDLDRALMRVGCAAGATSDAVKN